MASAGELQRSDVVDNDRSGRQFNASEPAHGRTNRQVEIPSRWITNIPAQTRQLGLPTLGKQRREPGESGHVTPTAPTPEPGPAR